MSKICDSSETSIARRISAFRRRAKITQKKIATALGLDQSTYCAMEKEKQNIAANYLPTIAEILGVEISEFFEDLSENKMLDRKAKKLLANWQNCLDTDKDTIMKTVKAMADRAKLLENKKIAT